MRWGGGKERKLECMAEVIAGLSLQPRRISAVSVAERVAQERCEEVGMTAGYSVRFESVLPRHYASILFCTVGKGPDLLIACVAVY